MPASFARHCRLLRIATLLVAAALGVLVALGWLGTPLLAGVESMPRGSARWLALRGIVALPALGYLWALWSAQHALGELAAGRNFHPTVSRALRRIGIGVLFGALAEVFALTNLLRLVLGGSGSYAYVDLSAIVLGVIGASLLLLARLVDEARALQAELAGIV